MSAEIQPLLERIRNEGLKTAEEEKGRILKAAREEAESIRDAARAEAAALRAQAEREGEAALQRGQKSLEQAARDLLLRFRSEMGAQLRRLSVRAAEAPLRSTEVLTKLLPELARQQSKGSKWVLEADSQLASLLQDLLPALLRDLGEDQEARVVMNPRTGAGFQLRLEDSAKGIDFTAEAVADWLAASLRPELAALMQTAAKSE